MFAEYPAGRLIREWCWIVATISGIMANIVQIKYELIDSKYTARKLSGVIRLVWWMAPIVVLHTEMVDCLASPTANRLAR